MFSFRLPGVDACPFQIRDRCWGVCVCVRTCVCAVWDCRGTSLHKWLGKLRVELCGVGAGLHRNPVPGFLGVRHSPAGASLQRVRSFRDFQPSDSAISGGAALPQKQSFINFFSG